MKKNSLIKTVTAALLVTAGVVQQMNALSPSEAQVPFLSYTYGVWDTSVPSSPAYEPVGSVTGNDLGIGAFASPDDMCKDNNGNICILDAGNRRIIKLDANMKVMGVIEIGTGHSLETGVSLSDPQGVCFDKNGRLFIADKGAQAVFVCNPDGTFIQKIIKPVSDIIDEKTEFQPTKCLVDSNGILYVLSFGSYEGAYSFDEKGDFIGFFGSNKVNVTSQLLSDRFWRLLATKAQRERMFRYVPIEYVNFTIDKNNFIYTVSNFGEAEQEGQVKKLNPLSQNILFYGQKPDMQFFGDRETTYSNRIERSSLVAVDIDDNGFISVLDFERGRIFQYDQDCNLITIFGGPGSQVGSFSGCADLIALNGNIYVLDSTKSNLTKFELTDYGRAIHKATVLYDDGFFEEALGPWFEALKMDRTNYLTLKGIGRAYERLGKYRDAMTYYKQGEAHHSYSEAFKEWRTEFLRKYFAIFMSVLILLLLTPIWKWIYHEVRHIPVKPIDHAVYISKYKFPFYLCLHPFKGWEELKNEKQGSLWFANVILVVWFVLQIAAYQFTGFQFNHNRLDQMNIFILFASTIGAFFLWAVCNWGVCTLFDGKGTFKEVWIFSAYSRMTYVLMEIPVILLSNVLAQDEGFFLQLVIGIQTGMSILQMVLAVKAAHQYTMKKTIWSSLLTLLGIVLVVLVILLFVSLFTQMWSFIETLCQEILMRV